MKRTKILAIALLVCLIIGAFAFTGCSVSQIIEDADYTEDYDSSNKEGSVALIQSFFEETLKDPNFVVTCKDKDGAVQYTESVKGTDSHMVSADGSELFAYIKGGEYYVANIGSEEDEEGNTRVVRTYWCSDSSKPGYYAPNDLGTMEDVYKSHYCASMNSHSGVNLVNLLPETGGTFACKVHGEKQDGVTTGTLEFTFTSDKGTMTITADSEENKVKTFTISVSDASAFHYSFAYGSASFELPDTDAWDREAEAERKRLEDNEKAVEIRNDFFSDTFCAENVVVTVTEDNAVKYSETIADGIDCIDFGSFLVYTYMKEKEDGENDYYYVHDGGEGDRYFLLNDDAYGSVVMFYSNQGICQYDEAGELEGVTMEAAVDGDTLTFAISLSGTPLATLVAVKDGDTVSTATFKTLGAEAVVYSFAYGAASLTEPDLSEFDNSSSEGTNG
ncbi:MAG: hypothetical protein IJU20_08380 [Clostridia bacterium]|nr:hypothetical protein [Clostridia bacterium]